MAVRSGRCPACGEDAHDDAPCHERPSATIKVATGGPCNCLPEPPADWRPCPCCGLPQAPGKSFCGFCGHRWPA